MRYSPGDAATCSAILIQKYNLKIHIMKFKNPDVCIIGSGAAGGIMAWEFARRGIKVVMIESGPWHPFEQRFEYMHRFLKGENPWQTKLPGLDLYSTGGSFPYYLEWNRVRGVGGSTLHWEGYTVRLHANDFRMFSLYGIKKDWPISYEEIEPYYGKAEIALGVAGTSDDPWGSFRGTPFPLPPFEFSYSDGFFTIGCKKLGIIMHHLPQARNSIAFDKRPQCQACGTCHVCPIGAKASVDITHIKKAIATGNVNVLMDSTVLRLETDHSQKVSGVIYAGHDRIEHSLSAPVVIIAAGAVETPRLLLLSTSRDFPNGLANRSGLVGNYFMSHPSIDVTGRVKEKVYPYRVGFSTAMTRQFAIDRNRAGKGAFFLEFLNSAGHKPEEIALSSGTWGKSLQRHVQEEFGHTLGVRVYCEQLPDINNSISLNTWKKDYFGNPVPKISYGIGEYERGALKEATEVAKTILQSAGAYDIQTSNLWYAAHQIGTHRMGKDSRSSVVDKNLCAHDVSNLYMVGSGCFVTASASPPTLTIAALAIRTAEHIASISRIGRPG